MARRGPGDPYSPLYKGRVRVSVPVGRRRVRQGDAVADRISTFYRIGYKKRRRELHGHEGGKTFGDVFFLGLGLVVGGYS